MLLSEDNGEGGSLHVSGGTGSGIRAQRWKNGGPHFTQSTKLLYVKPLLFSKSFFKGATGPWIKANLPEAHTNSFHTGWISTVDQLHNVAFVDLSLTVKHSTWQWWETPVQEP